MQKVKVIEVNMHEHEEVFHALKFCVLARRKWARQNEVWGLLQVKKVTVNKGATKLFTCTDGQRLHRIYCDDIPLSPGLYEIVKDTKSTIHLSAQKDNKAFFPDVAQLFKNYLEKEYSVIQTLANRRDNLGVSVSGSRIIKNLPANLTVNFSFLQDLFENYKVSSDVWALIDNTKENLSPIFIFNNQEVLTTDKDIIEKNLIAVLMPAKMAEVVP